MFTGLSFKVGWRGPASPTPAPVKSAGLPAAETAEYAEFLNLRSDLRQ